uniref:Uncharacterized protein n=1 Tax=Arundo donax TaxID=35708 RepID=A0A0A9ARR1_ARUDO
MQLLLVDCSGWSLYKVLITIGIVKCRTYKT